MMRALVTGASGMVGYCLVKRLLAAGLQVRALVRRTSEIHHLQRLPVEIVYGEATDRESIFNAVTGCHCVFHTAGVVDLRDIFSRGSDLGSRWPINVGFTEIALEASLRSGVARFVYVSSTSVYGLDVPMPTSEDAPRAPVSDYGYLKTMAEERVEAWGRQGLPTTIVRPGTIYGPFDRHLAPLVRTLARLPILLLVNGGGSLQDLVCVDDVVEVMWLASQSETAVGRIYNAGSGAPVPLRDLIIALRRHAGKPVRSVSVSPRALLRLAPLLRWYARGYAPGLEPVLTPIGLAYLSQDVYLDMSRARVELGYTPKGRVTHDLPAILSTAT